MEDQMQKMEELQSETSSEIAATWNTAQETLLAAIADRANCSRWLHSKSQNMFEWYNFCLTVPSIGISTFVGSATVGLPGLVPDPEMQKYATTSLGILGILVGILTSINQYMKTSQLAESHRAAGLAYGKIHRIVSCELALRRDQRINATEFLRLIRSEQDRLQETSPSISDSIILQFRKEFSDNTRLEKPEMCGDLDHCEVNQSMKPSSLASVRISGSSGASSPRFPLASSMTRTTENKTAPANDRLPILRTSDIHFSDEADDQLDRSNTGYTDL